MYFDIVLFHIRTKLKRESSVNNRVSWFADLKEPKRLEILTYILLYPSILDFLCISNLVHVRYCILMYFQLSSCLLLYFIVFQRLKFS